LVDVYADAESKKLQQTSNNPMKITRTDAMSKVNDIAKLFANLPGMDFATKVNKHVSNRNTVGEIVNTEMKQAMGKEDPKK